MDREEWRKTILSVCLQEDTCKIYDRGAAWCEHYPDEIRHCDFFRCPRVSSPDIGRAFITMMDRASYRAAITRIDAGTTFVKKMYHDVLRRDVNND